MTQKFSDGASINVLAVSSASIAPVGLYALPDSDVFPTMSVAGDVRGGSSTRSSPSSSPSLGPATPPPARSAFDIVSDAQKRALHRFDEFQLGARALGNNWQITAHRVI